MKRITEKQIITNQIMETVTTIKCKKPIQFRHEYKHQINLHDDLIVSQRLRKIFQHDVHANSHGSYRVSSLYLDTPYDKALREKIDGVNKREKFRIRYYNDDLSFIRLEKKMKINGLCAKQSAPLTQAQVQSILLGKIDFLLEAEHPLLNELYHKMRGQRLQPKTVVTYDREAFLYFPGNVRITMDRNVRTMTDFTKFLNPEIKHMDVVENITIMEVKYDNFLPEIVQMAVQLENRQAAAFSKYAVCRKYD